MTNASVETKATPTKAPAEIIAKNSEAIQKSGEAIQKSGEAIQKSGEAAAVGFNDLAKAYQEMATHSSERMAASLQALATVKTPMEFVELQQKLIKEAVDAAVTDGGTIARLTTAALAASFEPMQKNLHSVAATAALE